MENTCKRRGYHLYPRNGLPESSLSSSSSRREIHTCNDCLATTVTIYTYDKDGNVVSRVKQLVEP